MMDWQYNYSVAGLEYSFDKKLKKYQMNMDQSEASLRSNVSLKGLPGKYFPPFADTQLRCVTYSSR